MTRCFASFVVRLDKPNASRKGPPRFEMKGCSYLGQTDQIVDWLFPPSKLDDGSTRPYRPYVSVKELPGGSIPLIACDDMLSVVNLRWQDFCVVFGGLPVQLKQHREQNNWFVEYIVRDRVHINIVSTSRNKNPMVSRGHVGKHVLYKNWVARSSLHSADNWFEALETDLLGFQKHENIYSVPCRDCLHDVE